MMRLLDAFPVWVLVALKWLRASTGPANGSTGPASGSTGLASAWELFRRQELLLVARAELDAMGRGRQGWLARLVGQVVRDWIDEEIVALNLLMAVGLRAAGEVRRE